MLKDLAIAVSLLANVVLLSFLYFSADGNNGSSLVPVADEPVKQQQVDTVNVQTKLDVGPEPALLVCHQQCEPEEYQLMSTKLRDMKLGDEAIVRMVTEIALLSLTESDGCRTLSDPEFSHNTFECFDQQRRMLVSIFGREVKDNPLFESLFFPLNDTLDFLSSDEQIEVARLEIERTTRLEEIRYIPDREAQHEEAIDHFTRSVQELLSPEDYELYWARRSNAGRLFRFDYKMEEFFTSDAEYIAVVRILEEEIESPELAAVRLKDYFDPTRYAEFQKRRDPAYGSLKSVGDQYDLTDQVVMEVYRTQIELRELSDRLKRDSVPRELSRKEINDQLSRIKAELELRNTKEVANILIFVLRRTMHYRTNI